MYTVIALGKSKYWSNEKDDCFMFIAMHGLIGATIEWKNV